MSLVKHQLSFAAGELSPWLDGRTDIEKYAGGCRLLENFIVLPQGAVQKRPGMEYLGAMSGASAGRLVEFQVSTTEAAMLVLGGGKMAVYANALPVMDRQTAPLTLSGGIGPLDPASSAPGAVPATVIDGSYEVMAAPVNGKPAYSIDGGAVGTSGWNTQILYDLEFGWTIKVTKNGAHYVSWREGAPGDQPTPDLVRNWVREDVTKAKGTPAFARGAGTATLLIPIPWSDSELLSLRWKQINSVIYLVHPEHAPRKLTRFSAEDWELREVDYRLRPALLPENLIEEHTIRTSFPVAVPPWTLAAVTYFAGNRVSHAGKTWLCMRKHAATDARQPGAATAKYMEIVQKGREIQQVQKPLWIESFADQSAVTGQEIDLIATRDTWEAEHIGAIFEIGKERGTSAFEVIFKPAGGGPVYSNVLVVQGEWTLMTTGNWNGTFSLERSEDQGSSWEEVRAWSSEQDRNVSGEGEEERRVLMRIKWQKASGASGTGLGTPAPIATLTVNNLTIRGLVKITSRTDARNAKAEVITPVELTTTHHWRESAWNEVQGYPRTVELHQARVVMAATRMKPHTLWGSAVDDYENFYPRTEADASFAHTVAIGERDPVLWLVSERFLLVGTGCGEWIMHGEDEEKAITPEFGTAKRHSSYGAHDGGVPACFSDSVSLFVQRGGTRVREFSYRYEADRYEAANLNLLADHLFTEPVSDIAVQRMPWQIVWFVSGGKLYGLTYERAQNVAAWHRHSTQGEVLSVATIRATSEEDEVWFLVKRGTGLNIERFRAGQMARPADNGWWLDAASEVQPPFDFSSAVQLHGKKVAGWYDGRAYPEAILGYDQWPFVTGLEVSGLYNLAGPPLDGNPNGFYEVAGIRTGWPWFRHAALGDQFRIELVYFTNPGVFRWMIYVAGAESFRSQDLEAAEGMPDAGMFWEPVVDLGIGGPVIELLGEVPVDTPPATITVTGKLVPDATGVLNEKNPVNGKLAYGSYPEGYDPMDPEAEEIDYVRLYWSGSQWVLYCRQGPVEGTWVSDSDTPSPKFAMNWQVEMGAGIPSTGPVVVAGLRYDATLQPMTPEIGLGNGSSRSRELRIHRVVPSLRWSRGGKIGETPEGRLDPLDAGQGALFTGEIEKEFDGAHGTSGDVCVISDEPYPFAIRSLGLKMNVYGDQ